MPSPWGMRSLFCFVLFCPVLLFLSCTSVWFPVRSAARDYPSSSISPGKFARSRLVVCPQGKNDALARFDLCHIEFFMLHFVILLFSVLDFSAEFFQVDFFMLHFIFLLLFVVSIFRVHFYHFVFFNLLFLTLLAFDGNSALVEKRCAQRSHSKSFGAYETPSCFRKPCVRVIAT